MTAPLFSRVASLYHQVTRHRTLLIWTLILVFSLARTYQIARFPRTGSRDVHNIGLVVMRDLNPDLFASDYAYGDPEFLRFYSPGYMTLIKTLSQLAGDFEWGMVILSFINMLLLSSGAFLLYSRLGVRWWIALTAALWTTYPFIMVTGEPTGLENLNAASASRSYLALQPWIFLAASHLLSEDKRHKLWPFGLLGFLVGSSAILHMGPALWLAQAAGLVILVFFLNRQLGFKQLLAYVAGGLLGAGPTLWFYLSNTGTANTNSLRFQEFEEVIRFRVSSIFPYPVQVFGFDLGLQWQVAIACGIAVLTVLLLVLIIIQHRQQTRWIVLLGVFEIVIASLLGWGWLFGLIMLVWWLVAAQHRRDTIGWIEVSAIAAVNIMVWSLCALLVFLWSRFELWSLTILVLEEGRSSVLLVWPLRLSVALFGEWAAVQLKALLPGSRWITAAAILPIFVALNPVLSRLWVILFLVVLLVLIGLLRKGWLSQSLRQSVISGLVFLGILYVTLRLLGRTEFSIPLLISAALFFGISVVVHLTVFSRKSKILTLAGGSLLSLVVLLLIPASQSPFVPSTLASALVQSVRAEWVRDWSWDRTSSTAPETLALREMAAWARQNTPVGTLFYTDNFSFRYFSQRPITHSFKDIGSVTYSQSQLMGFYERYLLFENGMTDPDEFGDIIETYQPDYLLLDHGEQPPVDDLLTCYENDFFLVLGLESCPDDSVSAENPARQLRP